MQTASAIAQGATSKTSADGLGCVRLRPSARFGGRFVVVALLFYLADGAIAHSFAASHSVADFLIRVKSPHGANVILAFDVFAAVWILELVRSAQQRPIILTRDELQIRNGLRWTLRR